MKQTRNIYHKVNVSSVWYIYHSWKAELCKYLYAAVLPTFIFVHKQNWSYSDSYCAQKCTIYIITFNCWLEFLNCHKYAKYIHLLSIKKFKNALVSNKKFNGIIKSWYYTSILNRVTEIGISNFEYLIQYLIKNRLLKRQVERSFSSFLALRKLIKFKHSQKWR